jgi:predicted nuclease of restriction endonuclease-like RecB superfamily/Uma2 family endonuclease
MSRLLKAPLPGTTVDPRYPDSDGRCIGDTDFHNLAMIWLREALEDYFADQPDVYVASNLVFYFKEGVPKSHKDPDVLVARHTAGKRRRRSYRIWEEKVMPCTLFEMASRRTWRNDLGEKRDLYASLGVNEYFVYDPEGCFLKPVFQGFRTVKGRSVPQRPAADGSLVSRQLGVRLVPEDGMLRLIDLKTGQPVLTRAEQAEQHKERAEQLAAELERLRADREKIPMLTGKLVRVRYARDLIIPCYLDVADPELRAVAERLLELFRAPMGRTRGELEAELDAVFGDAPGQQVHQGLAKLLEDRCDFEVVAGQPPAQLREAVFAAAAFARKGESQAGRQGEKTGALSPDRPAPLSVFDREVVLRDVAEQLAMTPEAVEQGLFADLKSEQRLTHFKDTTAHRLLERYNVALAQAVLLRSTGMKVHIRQETPQRWRQLLRFVKFHRLVCEVEATGPEAWCLRVEGPLSLFLATQKYGLQLALFLPAVLRCQDFDLEAELRWGPQRRPRRFKLSSQDGLVSHQADTGVYVPAELQMFVDLFRKKVADWDISELTDLLPLGDTLWAPDYRLTHRASGAVVYLDVLGFWRRSSVERHLARLRHHAAVPFVLAISDQLHVEDTELDGLPAGIYRFRQMPLPEEVVRLAEAALQNPRG